MTHLRDTTNPFRGRILDEPPVVSNEDFRVVHDREPVVPGHLLLFTTAEVASLADASADLASFLKNEFANRFSEQEFVLIEKGRSRSCTSFGNVIHAHAHLVPAEAMKHEVSLAESAVNAASLADALRMVKDEHQYLLIGGLGGAFRVLSPLHGAPKRLARSIIREATNIAYASSA